MIISSLGIIGLKSFYNTFIHKLEDQVIFGAKKLLQHMDGQKLMYPQNDWELYLIQVTH